MVKGEKIMIIEKQSLFSTNIASFKYEGHEAFKEKWIAFKKNRDTTNMGRAARYNMWTSDPDMFEELGVIFKKCAIQYLKEFYNSVPDIKNLYLEKGWINTITPNNYLNVHCHRGKYLAVTYYMETPKNCGNLVLVDPRSNGEWLSSPYIINGRVEFEPQEGVITIFPGWIMHYIDINKSEFDRVSFSSNICLADKKR